MIEKKRAWIKSFGYAWHGLRVAVQSEKNMRVHLILATTACLLAFIYDLSAVETSLLVMTIAIVFIAELLNTAIEKTVDFISPQFHEQAKIIKDIAAGAVLVAALASVAVGYMLFFTKMCG